LPCFPQAPAPLPAANIGRWPSQSAIALTTADSRFALFSSTAPPRGLCQRAPEGLIPPRATGPGRWQSRTCHRVYHLSNISLQIFGDAGPIHEPGWGRLVPTRTWFHRGSWEEPSPTPFSSPSCISLVADATHAFASGSGGTSWRHLGRVPHYFPNFSFSPNPPTTPAIQPLLAPSNNLPLPSGRVALLGTSFMTKCQQIRESPRALGPLDRAVRGRLSNHPRRPAPPGPTGTPGHRRAE